MKKFQVEEMVVDLEEKGKNKKNLTGKVEDEKWDKEIKVKTMVKS